MTPPAGATGVFCGRSKVASASGGETVEETEAPSVKKQTSAGREEDRNKHVHGKKTSSYCSRLIGQLGISAVPWLDEGGTTEEVSRGDKMKKTIWGLNQKFIPELQKSLKHVKHKYIIIWCIYYNQPHPHHVGSKIIMKFKVQLYKETKEILWLIIRSETNWFQVSFTSSSL